MSNKEPYISVIMSVYNGEKYLPIAIDSILNQTFTRFEFIILNDGSNDETQNILDSYTHDNLRVITRQNHGLPLSLNYAIELAKGDYIVRMDADDIALPNRIKLQLEYMRSHPDIDILGGQARIIDENGGEIGVIRKPITEEEIVRYINYACPIIHPTYMVKANVYRVLNGYRNFVAVEDYDFLLRAHNAGYKLGNVSDDVILYRHCSTGISATYAKNQMAGTRLCQKLYLARLSGNPEPDNIVDTLMQRGRQPSYWFEICWRTRNKLLIAAQKLTGNKRKYVMTKVFIISLLHPELIYAGYRGWKSKNYKIL